MVPVSEKLRRDPWGFRQQGWSTPTETGINYGERRQFDIISASTTGVWIWTAEIETVIDIATPRRRLKSFENRLKSTTGCERAQLLAFWQNNRFKRTQLFNPCILGTKLLQNTNRKPHPVFWMVPLSMTLIDRRLGFQGRDIARHWISQERTRDRAIVTIEHQ